MRPMRNGWCSPPAVYHIAPSGPLTIPPRSLPGSGVAYSTMVARDSVVEIEAGGCMLGGAHAVVAMLNASALDRIAARRPTSRGIGGRGWNRTSDFADVNRAFLPLNYAPCRLMLRAFARPPRKTGRRGLLEDDEVRDDGGDAEEHQAPDRSDRDAPQIPHHEAVLRRRVSRQRLRRLAGRARDRAWAGEPGTRRRRRAAHALFARRGNRAGAADRALARSGATFLRHRRPNDTRRLAFRAW